MSFHGHYRSRAYEREEIDRGLQLLRRTIAAVILVPLGILIIAFAVANRQPVTVSLDPFSPGEPAASVTLPLFALLIFLLIVGVIIGGIAAWLRQGRWRATARRLEQEARTLRAKLHGASGTSAVPPHARPAPDHPPRLTLRPPVG